MSRKYIYCFQVSSNFLLLLLLGDLFDSEKQQQKNSITSQLSLNFVKRKTGKKKNLPMIDKLVFISIIRYLSIQYNECHHQTSITKSSKFGWSLVILRAEPIIQAYIPYFINLFLICSKHSTVKPEITFPKASVI